MLSFSLTDQIKKILKLLLICGRFSYCNHLHHTFSLTLHKSVHIKHKLCITALPVIIYQLSLLMPYSVSVYLSFSLSLSLPLYIFFTLSLSLYLSFHSLSLSLSIFLTLSLSLSFSHSLSLSAYLSLSFSLSVSFYLSKKSLQFQVLRQNACSCGSKSATTHLLYRRLSTVLSYLHKFSTLISNLSVTRTGGHLIEFHLIESVDRKFLII
jgi:hypothetical protein